MERTTCQATPRALTAPHQPTRCRGELEWVECRDPYWRHVDPPAIPHAAVPPRQES